MKCPEADDLIQHYLDSGEVAFELEAHAALCPACRELLTAAERLREGTARAGAALAPRGLAGCIARAVLRDRARRRGGRALALVAAAAVLALVLGGRFWPEAAPQRGGVGLTASDTAPGHTPQQPSLERFHADKEALARLELPPESERAWNAAVGGVALCFEPLTDSAKRAADLFRREMPFLATIDKETSRQ